MKAADSVAGPQSVNRGYVENRAMKKESTRGRERAKLLEREHPD
jgi:hypothetical protein